MHFTWIIKMHLKFGIVLISGEELSNSDSVTVILSELFKLLVIMKMKFVVEKNWIVKIVVEF